MALLFLTQTEVDAVPQTEQTDNSQKPKQKVFFRGGFWWITIGATILIGTVIRLSRVFATQAEQYTFIAQAVVNVLIFAAILVQALIYRRQWQVMEGQWDAMQEGLNQTDRVIEKMQGQWDAMESQAKIMKESLAETRAMTKITEQSVEVARQAMVIGTQAYVGVHSLEAHLGNETVILRLENIGRVPTEWIKLHVRVSRIREDGLYTRVYEIDLGSIKLLPGNFPIPVKIPLDELTRHEATSILNGEVSLSIGGIIEYGNGFKNAEENEFGFEFRIDPERWFPLPVSFQRAEELQAKQVEVIKGDEEQEEN